MTDQPDPAPRFDRRHLAHSLAYCMHICWPSPEWQVLRAQVMIRSDGRCEVCRTATATQVHHVTYERLGHEDVERDLLAVCRGCHAGITSPAEQAALARNRDLAGDLADDIAQAWCREDWPELARLLPPGWAVHDG